MQKKKIVIIFILSLFIHSIVFSQIFGLPVPRNTKLVSKNKEEIVGSPFTIYQYHSTFSQGEILQFYQDKLRARGWSKMDLPVAQISRALQGRVYNFVKGDEMLVLDFSPLKAEGLIFYSISVGKLSKVQGAEGKAEQPLDMFKEPKPLDFMPIYPGSKQVDYRKTSSILQVGYMATGGIEAVKGFYLQKMPQQGWSLRDEKYIGEDQYDISKIETDCPTCPKIPPAVKEVMANIKMKGVTLEFEQKEKICLMNVTEMGNSGMDLTSLGLGDTMITVLYHDKK